MLRKLLKHEFRATGRIMLPMYLVLLVTALGSNLAGRKMLDGPDILNTLGVLIVMAFGFAICGVMLMSFVLMIQRFYKNLLQDEGYLMFTLPASVHQHIWSKLIVSSVWFIVTVLAIIAASLVVAYQEDSCGSCWTSSDISWRGCGSWKSARRLTAPSIWRSLPF